MGDDEDRKMELKAPTIKYEINLNTMVMLIGFTVGAISWGASWQRISSGLEGATRQIDYLDSRVTKIEVANRQLDNHELRISALEKAQSDTATQMRSLETAINSLSSDVRVTREIVERLDPLRTRRTDVTPSRP